MKVRSTKIFLNMVSNMAVSYLLFFAGISQTENRAVCFVVAVLLHYTLLVTWFWKAAYAYEVYLSLVKVQLVHTYRYELNNSFFTHCNILKICHSHQKQSKRFCVLEFCVTMIYKYYFNTIYPYIYRVSQKKGD